MKQVTFVLVLIYLFTSAGCDKINQTNNALDSFSITYQIQSTWVNYVYTATLDQNGKLGIFEESGLGNQSRKSEYTVSEEKMYMIKEKLSKLVAINLEVEYGFSTDNKPTDLPVRKIKYITKDKADSSSLYFPLENELPDELNSFLHVIEKVVKEKDDVKYSL